MQTRSAPGEQLTHDAQRWEYRILRVGSQGFTASGDDGRANTTQVETEMNQLGSAGWDLVTVQQAAVSSTSTMFLFVFKRLKTTD
jgi:hypothetical protein